MITALMPVPRQQFCSANGVPLAGGLLYSYAAGTTTPLATYQDAAGAAANTNPVVLDAGGFASVWLSTALYKIVLTDVNGVTQWTQDNVSAVSQTELQGASTFAMLTVTGNGTVDGNFTVDGALSAASVATTGSAAIGGNLTAATAAITGNESVGGALSVAGATTLTGAATLDGALTVEGAAALASLSVGGTDIATLIGNVLGAATALSGDLVVSSVGAVSVSGGYWFVFTFGTVAGTRFQIAIGSGLGSSGFTVPVPSGFISTNSIINVAINGVAAVSGNLENFTCSVTSNVLAFTGLDSGGHTPTATLLWTGVAWRQNV